MICDDCKAAVDTASGRIVHTRRVDRRRALGGHTRCVDGQGCTCQHRAGPRR